MEFIDFCDLQDKITQPIQIDSYEKEYKTCCENKTLQIITYYENDLIYADQI